jgi:hypothetical protein
LTSSDHNDEGLEDADAPGELALQPDEKDYDTDDDLYYASDSDGELEERIQTFSEDHEFAFIWRIEDSKNKSLCESVNAIVPSKWIFAPLDVFQEWYRNQLAVNFKDYRFTGLVFKALRQRRRE